ncbi:MAG TPA: molecular chaperone Tir [Bacteroidales bacterium]|nr:molecular chaperone Tir [Bacteroidales bacterium]
MNVFINSNNSDKEYVYLIKDTLTKAGHKVVLRDLKIKAGDNLFKKIDEEISKCDAIILFLNQKTLNSKMELKEIESIVLNEITRKKTLIIPVRTDDSLLPSYLMNYQVIDFSQGLELGLEKLVLLLSDSKGGIERNEDSILKDNNDRNQTFIQQLNQALKLGDLTLICGAGISVGANIPAWNDLLFDLLETMIRKISNRKVIPVDSINKDYKSIFSSSSLIMGKYLKTNLGKDFLPALRDTLYKKNPVTCDLIEAIVEMSRPQRDGKPLNSIITFNFDALIEENLKKHNIKFKAIDNEGIRNNPTELPIYHVHGYLPRTGKIPSNTSIIFSEDAYHTQFIDPFSWSNLIQLNKLSQNTCLFVGLSLTDPNLRRLLDVAHRKNPSSSLNHYIIKKIPNVKGSEQTDELMMFLEEQDANELGLNVLWVKEFDKIGKLIKNLI